ncbi:MAG TPA: TonB-dependent siderophore receptor [Sphingomicrobium sp.]|nr:TonB-dependent siderophore receptor [Sphingomicrobium sp.]
MDRLHTLPLAAALLCGTMPVHAAAVPAASADSSADAEGQPEIVVTGERVPYGVKVTTTATKTATDIRNIPQALTIVSSQQIADQQLRSIGDLLLFVPGASYNSGEGNRDTLVLRGNSSTADFFIDGVRDDVQYFRDFYNIDRVEVLKGPNAMIFGRGGGGGIVNRVLKRPSLSVARRATASGDGWGGRRISADLDQPLSDALGVRLNGVYENSDSFRRHVDLKRYGINPTAAVLLGPDTRVDLSYEYFHDRRTADRGVPANGNKPIRGFTRTFFGDPDKSFAKANVNLATLAVEHRFAEGLTLKNRTMFGDYDKFYQNIFPASFNPATQRVTLSGYNNRNDRKTLFSQTDLVWENRLAGIDQTLLLGFELGREKSRNRRTTASFVGSNSVPVSDPTVDANVIFAPSATDSNNRVKANVAALYVQDQLRPASWVEIVAGLRFDSFKIDVDDFRANGGGRFGRRDHLWSPRLGLILKPSDDLSLYASYSRSYLPQSGDQFSSLTDVTEGLKPERFDNYEVGAKLQLPGGLLATAAVYQLDRTNTRATDPLTLLTVLTGAQRSRGLELGLERSITSRWLVSAGYTLQEAKITKTTTAAPAGRKVPLVPRHSFSLWNRYDFTKTIGAGLGVIARSKSYASISNAVKLPGYARVDAALYYQLPGGIEAQLNLENLLGAHYFPTANSDNNISPGAPRTVKASIGYRF